MKKTILFLSLFISGFAVAQTPVAIRNIGVDSTVMLEKRAVVNRIIIDSDLSVVRVEYRIETLSPNNQVVSVSELRSYSRTNLPNDARFDNLRNSAIGVAIKAMVEADLVNYPNLNQEYNPR